MKFAKMFLVAVMVMFSASFGFAADDIKIKTQATGGAAQSAAESAAASSSAAGAESNNNNNLNVPGPMPVATTHGARLPNTPMSEYGNLITQMSGSLLGPCEPFSGKNFESMISAMKEAGGEDWDDVNKKIIPYPFIKTKLPSLGKEGQVYFIDQRTFSRIMKNSPSKVRMVGGYAYNSEFKKEEPVIPLYYTPRAYLDAANYGANVVVRAEQYFQAYFVPEGFEFSLGGVLSWISRIFTSGGSIAGNASYASGRNTEFGRTGAAFIFLHIDGFMPEMCMEKSEVTYVVTPPAPKPVEVKPAPVCDAKKIGNIYDRLEKNRIAIEGDLRKGQKGCEVYCLNNLKLRLERMRLFYELFKCTGDAEAKRKVLENSEIASRNYKFGHDIKKNQAESDETIAQVYKIWASIQKEGVK